MIVIGVVGIAVDVAVDASATLDIEAAFVAVLLAIVVEDVAATLKTILCVPSPLHPKQLNNDFIFIHFASLL